MDTNLHFFFDREVALCPSGKGEFWKKNFKRIWQKMGTYRKDWALLKSDVKKKKKKEIPHQDLRHNMLLLF